MPASVRACTHANVASLPYASFRVLCAPRVFDRGPGARGKVNAREDSVEVKPQLSLQCDVRKEWPRQLPGRCSDGMLALT